MVGAAAHAYELAQHEGIGRRLDHRNHESCERVAYRNEAADKFAIGPTLETTNSSAASEHTIDFAHRVLADVVSVDAALGQRTQNRAYATGIGQRGGCTGGLLLSAPPNS